MTLKIGFGYDLHRLKPGKKLFLGGVEIPYPKGLEGHSDGDCLVHALADALLGALGEKDIGQHFPDNDPAYKDIRSTELLKKVMDSVEEHGYSVMNMDSVIVAEEPELATFIQAMKKILSSILEVEVGALAIKAKTNEGLGLIGKGKAIACWAVVLLGRKE